MEVSVDDDSGLETVVISTSGPLETGWQQVAVVFKADALELYLNGELVGSAIPMSLPIELGETTENWLGMSIDPLDNLFQGALDDVRIYNRALSQVEIAELHGLD